MNDAVEKHKVYTGRTWPIWPEKVRVTMGTLEELGKFTVALDGFERVGRTWDTRTLAASIPDAGQTRPGEGVKE